MKVIAFLSVSLTVVSLAAAANAVPPSAPTGFGSGYANPYASYLSSTPAPSAQTPMYVAENTPRLIPPGTYPVAAWQPSQPTVAQPPIASVQQETVPEAVNSPAPYGQGAGGYYDNDGNYYAGDSCESGNCGPYEACRRRLRGGWYGSLAGLAMTRNLPSRMTLTSEVGFPDVTRLSNRSAGVGRRGGFEVSFGRYIEKNLRWEASYWTLSPFSGFGNALDPGGFSLNTPLDFDNVFVGGGGDTATTFFDGSAGHEVFREDELHNVEVNFYYRPECFSGYRSTGCDSIGSCCPWDFEFLTGFRFMRFDEYFIFAGARGGSSFGANGGADELYVESDVENNLIGWQFGALLQYRVHDNWTLFVRPKFGIYGNHSTLDFDVRRGDNGAVVTAANGDTYPIRSYRNDVAFLSEIDFGIRWNMTRHWSAYASYRVVSVAGVAMADSQIPFLLADTPGIRNINSDDSLYLHGAVFGLQFQY